MTAIEEEIQQVVDLVGTSERVKTLLEDSINRSNCIYSLLRSITIDTILKEKIPIP